MRDRGIGTKIGFCIFSIACCFIIFSAGVQKDLASEILLIFLGGVFLIVSALMAHAIGSGNLMSPSELKRYSIFTVIQSHALIEGEGYAVCIKNTRGQDLWVRFKEVPPTHFKVDKVGSDFVYLSFPPELPKGESKE